MDVFARWLLDKSGGVAVGALLTMLSQWLHSWATSNPSISGLGFGLAVALVFGAIAVFFGRNPSDGKESTSATPNMQNDKRIITELEALVADKQRGCERRDQMVAQREHVVLNIFLDHSERIQKELDGHELPSNYRPLHSSSYADSALPWDYKMRRMGCLKEQISHLSLDAGMVWQALEFREQPAFFDSVKKESITLGELQGSLAKFSNMLETRLGVLAPQLPRIT